MKSTNVKSWYKETPNKNAITFPTIIRFELNKNDKCVCDSSRAEIRSDNEQPLEEHVYSFYILLSNGGEEDYVIDENSSDIIAQWHNQPDINEEYTSPPISLHTYNGEYIVQRCWDDAEITTNQQMIQKGNYDSHNLGSYISDKGRWVKWSFHIKWGWLSSQNPILEVYKDDKLVLNCNGMPNTTNDKVGIYMKLGIYKWSWSQANDESKVTRRVIYFKDVNIK